MFVITKSQLLDNNTLEYANTTAASRRTHQITTILDGLLKDYDLNIRPNFGEGPTKIGFDVLVSSFGPIQDMDMSFTMNCYFRQRWRDERLQFAKEVGELSLSTRMLERLWRPDTIFYNSKHSYLHTIPTSNRLWRLSPDGSIWYSARLTVKARCNMNLRNFPVDTQICKFLIGSFANSALDIQYGWRLGNNRSVNFDMKVLLSQFDLIRYPQYNEIIDMNGRMYTKLYNIKSIELFPGNFSILRVDFVLKRHMGYYILQVYIPSTMLVMLSWVSFFIHREATADRVNIGVMTFLSLTTLSFDIRNYTAVVSYLTALDWFVIMAYGFLLASLLQFAFVHYFTKFGYGEPLLRYRGSTDSREVPEGGSMRIKRTSKTRTSVSYSRFLNMNQQTTQIQDGPWLTRVQLHIYRFWFCLSGNGAYKRAICKRASRYGINSRSELDVFARIAFPLSFALFNILYWFYFLHLQY
ncbi:unnamed protein product [Adineta steineri]|uniref:Uncharacterized protein n=1 Tax=Adineta steineri TaxID=433720 RepID=A0A814C154_9BILA|nr:unnamed protein product [Adineta steineri]CAF0971096.1 unnamed protein product [Adineta steineri]CAF1038402.1 unnamed protein product [Adineta steineri]